MAARDLRQEDAGEPRPGATYVISVAAQLAGMHPQTLRQYDRLGLVVPARRKGRGRSYSASDIHRLRQIQQLSQDEGINLEGIRRILDMQDELDMLRAARDEMRQRLDELQERAQRVFAATSTGEVSALRRGQRPWGSSSFGRMTGDAEGFGADGRGSAGVGANGIGADGLPVDPDARALVLWATGRAGARAPLSRRLPPPPS